tara:strand:- start:105108 stop:105623 length:516 start_codon:yes stop_codon:yes gene_type:complete
MSEEIKLNPKKLQWAKSEKIGQVETIKGSDGKWTVFESGNRVDTSLLGEYLIPVEGTPLSFVSEHVQQSTTSLSLKTSGSSTPNTQNLAVSRDSPVLALLRKIEDFDTHRILIEVNVNIPKKNVSDLISSTFGRGEFDAALELFITEQVNDVILVRDFKEKFDVFLKNLKE